MPCMVGGSRPTPREKLRGLTKGSPGPHSGGSPGPHPGGLQANTRGGGLCIPAYIEADPPPPWTATAVGSTHPTGMHSCT